MSVKIKSKLNYLFDNSILGIFFNPFYFTRKELYNSIKGLAPSLGGKVIDIGCGTKPYKHLFTNSKSYIGVDIEVSGNGDNKNQVDIFYNGSVLPFENASIDHVFSSETFEHVFNLETIISETKTRVDRLMNESHKKVEIGTQTAKQCNDALEEILQQVSSVDGLVSEIAVASQEQSTGIREISKAVGQLEEVTQQNSSVAQSSSISSEQLRAQATQLDSLVRGLAGIIHGDSSQRGSDSSSETATSKKGGDVVKLEQYRPQNNSKAQAEVPLKRASGSDYVPSADDAGFEE